jgi:hypothetical protein
MKINTLKSVLTLAAGIVSFTSASSDAALTSSPLEYWDFNGDALAGVDNANNDGTILNTNGGTAAFVAGKFGQAIDLESTGAATAWVSVDDPDNTFDMENDIGTISLWFQVESFDRNWQALVTAGEGGAWRIHRQGGSQRLNINMGGQSVVNTSDITVGGAGDGTWHHIAISNDAANGTQMWFDGALSANAAVRDTTGNNLPFAIGNNANDLNRAWDGLIDDVAFWDTALTDADVQQIWNGGTGASIESLAIPEPTALSLFGMVGLAMMLRRRRG